MPSRIRLEDDYQQGHRGVTFPSSIWSTGNPDVERQDGNQQNAMTGLKKAELFKAVMGACVERISQEMDLTSSDVGRPLNELAVRYETSCPVTNGSAPSVKFLHRWAEA